MFKRLLEMGPVARCPLVEAKRKATLMILEISLMTCSKMLRSVTSSSKRARILQTKMRTTMMMRTMTMRTEAMPSWEGSKSPVLGQA